MGWKNWPYWLKGGIIGAVIYEILMIISSIYNKNYVIDMFSGLLSELKQFSYGGDYLDDFVGFFVILFSIPLSIFLFLFGGALVGFIIGKIKLRPALSTTKGNLSELNKKNGSDKEGWKNWPYWLKGVLIGGVVYGVFMIISSVFSGYLWYYFIHLVWVGGLIDFFVYLFSIPWSLFLFSLIGALIGFIIGKFKSKN